LHVIREFEYKKIIAQFPKKATVLEIGGGTGYQAKRLAEDGFNVESIDIPDSTYSGQMDFSIQSYDGRHIPFPDHSFDIVFSSNVLEHIKDISDFQLEIRRVLKRDGYCVHLMPSGAWRFWTNIAHYIEGLQHISLLIIRLISSRLSRHLVYDLINFLRNIKSAVRHYALVPRHGETGNALTEIYTFSALHWRKHFVSQHFVIDQVIPIGLFYTGHMVLGKRMSLKVRQVLSKWLGSACVIYVVHPS